VTLINVFIRYIHIKNKNDRKGYSSQFGLNDRSLQAAFQVYGHLEKIMKKLKIPIISTDDEVENVLKSILTGFFDKVAQRQPDGSYKGVRSKDSLYLHPHSLMNAIFPDWVVYNEIVRTGKNYMREVSEINHKWLVEIAPHFYEDNKVKILEAKHRREIEEYDGLNKVTKKVKTEDTKSTMNKKRNNFVISDMDFDV